VNIGLSRVSDALTLRLRASVHAFFDKGRGACRDEHHIWCYLALSLWLGASEAEPQLSFDKLCPAYAKASSFAQSATADKSGGQSEGCFELLGPELREILRPMGSG
jgi:hypothetical protein